MDGGGESVFGGGFEGSVAFEAGCDGAFGFGGAGFGGAGTGGSAGPWKSEYDRRLIGDLAPGTGEGVLGGSGRVSCCFIIY